uniref:ORF44c n=1 Tax=Pinus thunbergii TaxID=3350 RepID=Q32976_PINTH|nr:ORF44c [Pinus thunbergii]
MIQSPPRKDERTFFTTSSYFRKSSIIPVNPTYSDRLIKNLRQIN